VATAGGHAEGQCRRHVRHAQILGDGRMRDAAVVHMQPRPSMRIVLQHLAVSAAGQGQHVWQHDAVQGLTGILKVIQ
jgi:hypothetical protein